MIREYSVGRTPNPDVMCNKYVKFGAFFDKAVKLGADIVATGHYARSENGKMLAGVDKEKDQSYFLWTLTQKQIKKTLFPVGGMEKSEVRKLAKKFGLPVADKKDSQGLCFVGHVDMKDFLKKYIKTKPGSVLNESGEVIGTHDGAELYTIGERHGFVVTKKGTSDTPFYVVSKNISNNAIVVSQRSDLLAQVGLGDVWRSDLQTLELVDVNWIAGAEPDLTKKYTARIRYRQPLQKCSINYRGDTSSGGITSIVFGEPQRAVTPGQSCVIYDGDICLGGGIIG
jgi:tRNA-specific 2-thiouridylase